MDFTFFSSSYCIVAAKKILDSSLKFPQELNIFPQHLEVMADQK